MYIDYTDQKLVKITEKVLQVLLAKIFKNLGKQVQPKYKMLCMPFEAIFRE